MIILKQEHKTMNAELKGIEKQLSKSWDEKVIIIPHGYSLVGFIEEKNTKAFENKKDKSSELFNINKSQLRLIKAGLEARDNHNAKIIKERRSMHKSFEERCANRPIVVSCINEHEDILNIVKKDR